MAKPVGADNTRKSGTPREILGLAITRLRTGRGESQVDMAARVGCQEYYLRNIEQGKENPSFDLVYAIVDHLNMLPMSKFWTYAEDLVSGRQEAPLP